MLCSKLVHPDIPLSVIRAVQLQVEVYFETLLQKKNLDALRKESRGGGLDSFNSNY